MKNAQYVQIACLALIIIGCLSYISKTQINNRSQVASISGAGSGLELYYALDEGSGTTATDGTGNNHTGTLNGDAAWLTPAKVGASGISFSGTSGGGVSFSRIHLGTTFTYSAWIYIPSGSVNAFANLISNGGGIGFWVVADKVRLDGGAGGTLNGNTTIPRDSWHHIAVVDNAGAVTFYFDGVADGSGTATTDMFFDGFGCDTGTGGECFRGYQDDVRVYTTALQPGDISSLYSFGGGATQPPQQNPPPSSGFALTVSKSGTGSGTVTGTGISCGLDCSENYTTATSITLTASAGTGSTFAGWSGGGCSGTGTCTTTVSTNTTVTATFDSVTAPPTSGPTTYYVSTTGSDTSNGGQSAPWRTIQHCADMAKAGDTCSVAPGTYSEFIFTKADGTDDTHRVTFVSQTKWGAKVNGFFFASRYQTIDSFDITNPNGQYNGSIVSGVNGSFCNIFNNYIHNTPTMGINFVSNGSGQGATNCIIRGNTISNLNDNFLSMAAGGYHLVENNIFEIYNSNDFIRLLSSNNTIRRNIFRNGNDTGAGHPDLIQVFGNQFYPVISDNVFEENWVQDIDGQLGMLSSDDGVAIGQIYPGIKNLIYRRNVFINTTQNLNIVMPGVTLENNTFYHAMNTLDGVPISGTYERGNSPNATVKNNVFLANGSLPNAQNDFRGFYYNSGASFTSESAATWVTNGDWTAANAINDNLQKNGYTSDGSNGYLTAKAKALTSITQFVFDPVGGYSTYKQATYDQLIKVVQLHNLMMSTFYADYNYVAGDAPNYYSKDTRGCPADGSYGFRLFCEIHGINGGNPNLRSLTNFMGPDGIPFTLDDGLKPQSGSILCGKGTNGVDIGAYSCNPNIVFMSGSTDTGGITSPPPPTGDTTAPTVSITAPTAGTAVTGVVTITANASDNVGVAGVQFKVNGTNVGAEDTTSPYSVSWDTSALAAGTYSITAVARDAALNITTSGAVSVTKGSTTPTPDPSLPCKIGTKTIRAVPVANTNSIQLSWPKNDFRKELHILKRVYSNRPSSWQSWTEIYTVTDPLQAALAGTYNDTNISSGIHYEYEISARESAWDCSDGPVLGIWSDYWSFQHINTGTNIPLKDQQGKLVLLVESGIASSLSAELTRLQNDLVGDGYKVFRHDVAAADVGTANWKSAVVATRNLIKADYNTDTSADWTVFIVGHVPVPYSGDSSPGSHTDNVGAHPADWYYADMTDSAWTDSSVNDTSSIYSASNNVPGDGKFDQSMVPSLPEMRIGRIDLRNMPAFGKTEVQLLKQYLDRDHNWRTKLTSARDRAIVNSNNNFGLIYTGAPYESHDTYASFFGTQSNTDIAAWLTAATTPSTSYLFSASSGNGQLTQDMQIGTTANFAATPLYVVFASMFGSYYGDWDSAAHPDIVIQAPLADAGYVVNNYYREDVMDFDPGTMGEPTGQQLFALASNHLSTSRWYLSYGWIYNGQTTVVAEDTHNYVSLLGDPTLKYRVVAPPTAVTVSVSGADNLVTWTSSADINIQGHLVYRAPASDPYNYTRLTSAPVTGSWRDPGAASGSYKYMVRAVKLEQSLNRSYYNASIGVIANPTTFVQKVGDFDGDGAVNSTDWSYMNSAWNTSNPTYDLNQDGKVNTLDLVILIKNWTN